MLRIFLLFIFVNLIYKQQLLAQNNTLSSNEIQLQLQKLNVLGSVLYFAAHPDDENTKLIAWLSQERKYKTAYLSLTRGDGGQNLIGNDQGIELGLIRTQELLAARSIDKGEQYFTSAYDFGFSKTHEETFQFWDKERILAEAVHIFRKLQPDVIITRFPPDKRGGHGHHQASAILAHEAFVAAADTTKFPEQLKTLQPWQAKRLVWNTANFGGMNNTSEDQLKIDIGNYNPLLGKSYGEIAAASRSQHKSQGFGSASSRGTSIEYFEHVAGDKASKDLFEGIETSWKRLENGTSIEKLINKINTDFNPLQPQNSIQDLVVLRKLIFNSSFKNKLLNKAESTYKTSKLADIDKIILACAGINIEAIVNKKQYSTKENINIQLEVIVRSANLNVSVEQVNNQTVKQKLEYNTIKKFETYYTHHSTTQPYWLEHPNSLGKYNFQMDFVGDAWNNYDPCIPVTLSINNENVNFNVPINYKEVDPIHGEIHTDITITPSLTASVSKNLAISTNLSTNTIELTFQKHSDFKVNPIVKVIAPKDWKIDNEDLHLDFSNTNFITKRINVTPLSSDTKKGNITLSYDGKPLRAIKTINYNHIPAITYFPLAKIELQNISINNPIKKIGYIQGAGDLVAQSLSEIGIEATVLDPKKIKETDLSSFDAIVIGVRYFNIDPLAAHTYDIIDQYVKNGGVALFQYTVNTRIQTKKLGPYPFTISKERVTEEDAEVKFDSNNMNFVYPNKITKNDFDGWIQERGLYFADNIDPKYSTPIQIHDKNEPSHNGSLLITKYGKGKYVYTSLSFFRQLPAGVPGAYRLFVNLLSKEK